MRPDVGLCSECRHARTVTTPRSTFWRCELSKTDPRFPRHPRLPVLACAGYEVGEPRASAGRERGPGEDPE